MSDIKKCWEIFECVNQECPVRGSNEPCCWLFSGNHCRKEIDGKFLEKMEICLACELFESNVDTACLQDTFRTISEQFRSYERKVKQQSEARNLELTAINASLQKEVAERERAEKACLNVNQELNSFIRTVSHDLKTPIIAIQGFSSRLLKVNSASFAKKGRKYLEQIIESAGRMEALVGDLLQLSKVGETESVLSNVASGDIIRKVSSSLEGVIRENGVQLTVASNLPRINCDETRIYQVFENLIVNAIKFTKDSKPPRIEVGYDSKGLFHQFYIRDNGIGIDPKHHLEIFDMFRQLKEIKDSEGTGLGLTIVQRIVNRRGGQVWVDSEKGKGATFYFTLPKTF